MELKFVVILHCWNSLLISALRFFVGWLIRQLSCVNWVNFGEESLISSNIILIFNWAVFSVEELFWNVKAMGAKMETEWNENVRYEVKMKDYCERVGRYCGQVLSVGFYGDCMRFSFLDFRKQKELWVFICYLFWIFENKRNFEFYLLVILMPLIYEETEGIRLVLWKGKQACALYHTSFKVYSFVLCSWDLRVDDCSRIWVNGTC